MSVKNDKELDESPKTADETDLITWLIIITISILLTIISGICCIKSKEKDIYPSNIIDSGFYQVTNNSLTR